jgi:hypothetical protein
LRDKTGLGDFQWLQPRTVGAYQGFRNWRRFEPNNHTVSEGKSTPGELCVHMVPGQEDPLLIEEGSWNDVSCSQVRKPFICQIYADTLRRQWNVNGRAVISGGLLEGGIINLYGASSTVADFALWKSASLTFYPSSTGSTLGSLALEDGSALIIQTTINMKQTAMIGEGVTSLGMISYGNNESLSSTTAMQPTVTLGSTAELACLSSCADCHSSYNVNINARVSGDGTILVEDNIELNFDQVRQDERMTSQSNKCININDICIEPFVNRADS